MRVLITGGLGFIGTNLCLKCIDLGWETVVVDSGKTKDHKIRKQIIFNRGNPKIYEQNLKSFLITSKFKDFDVIFHLAAQPSVPYSVEQPYKSFVNNINDTTLLLITESLNKMPDVKFVFSSSAAVYGNVSYFPIDENAETKPSSPYGLHKLFGEQLFRLHANLNNLNSICLRYFNAYGPYQFANGPYATAISSWLNCIKNNHSLRKDGTGEQTRDMVYVDDIVSANILAATNDRRFLGDAVNIASGIEMSNNQILDMLRNKFDIEIENAPARIGDIQRSCASIHKAKILLNYEPKYSFADGLAATIDSLSI